MVTRLLKNSEKIWVKNGQIHFDSILYDVENLKKIIVQVSDLTFISDTVRLVLVFEAEALIVPSMHEYYDSLFEKLNKLVKINDDAYLKAMNCDTECDFVIYEK